MSAAAAHAHCNTTIDSAQLLDEGKQMMARVKVVERREDKKSTPIPPDAKVRNSQWGGEVRSILRARERRGLPTSQATAL